VLRSVSFSLPPDATAALIGRNGAGKTTTVRTIMGFPDFEQRGLKAAPHNHGPVVGPDDWGPQATEAELRPVGDALAALVPGAAGPIIDRDVCLYTNTVPADRLPDAGEEFIIDRWPDSA
jgi:sarcosine oxidase